ncbi:MAG: cupin domain-containing protein [Methylococcales bacterium]|nr:cupin domain-containing protein [Methylococcales bacterium]
MDAKNSSFAGLIDPIQPDEFFSQYWEKKPLYIRRADAQFYRQIITLDDAQSAITFGGLRYPAIQLAKSGAFLHPDVFCTDIPSGDILFTGVPDPDKLQAEFKAGATISLPGFNRAWRPLRRVAAAVEDYLEHAVHTNIYITPGNASGFSPHYDPHDVFIFQISGSKHWKIYPPPLNLPHRTQPFQPQMFAPTAPLLELDLEPGDLLYMPRGYIHAANTASCTSMHVTLGVTVYTFVDLVSIWLQTVKDEAGFRHAFPPGFASSPALKQGVVEEFSRLAEDFHRKLDAQQMVETFLQRVRDGHPGRCGDAEPFDLDVVVVSLQTRLKVLEKGMYTLTEEGDNIVLKFKGRTLVMSRRARATIDEMCRRAAFRCAELPPDLTEDARLTLMRHLYQQGFLMLSKQAA